LKIEKSLSGVESGMNKNSYKEKPSEAFPRKNNMIK